MTPQLRSASKRRIEIAYEEPASPCAGKAAPSESHLLDIQLSIQEEVLPETPSKKPKKKTQRSPKPPPPGFSPPGNWRVLYDRIKHIRQHDLPKAPVDTIGCDRLHEQSATPKQRRFQILVSLMLSSQTKDPVTAQAMSNLHQFCNEKYATLDGQVGVGVTVERVLQSSGIELNACINKVGYHNKKTEFLLQISRILKEKFDCDIPETASEIMELPGIGPKMAYLAVQAAWGKNEGIGVDTHVHRIVSRFRWVPHGTEEKGPEATRAALESWLPKDYWYEINHLLVGLGQVICYPRNPNCAACPANDICPSSSVKNKTDSKKADLEEAAF